MEKVSSVVPLDYKTIRITQSRIDKGLLAIPVSLANIFPKERGYIYLIDEHGDYKRKSYSPSSGSTRECRIGGLREFFNHFSIKDGDELVIQQFDDTVFRLLPDKIFSKQITDSLTEFETSDNEEHIQGALSEVAKIAHISSEQVIENEFVKLSENPIIPDRRLIKKTGKSSQREGIPYYLRNILKIVYDGKCQLTGFSFCMQNGEPYFEIHHIDPMKGNHIKNLLVVSPNVHAQFTYAKVDHIFDADKWLRTVKFNGEICNVFQKIDFLQKHFVKEIHIV